MRRVLANLLAGKPAADHIRGRSAHGGFDRVIRALRSRGLIDRGELTEMGRFFAERIAARSAGRVAQPKPPRESGPGDLPGQTSFLEDSDP
jgi:hypothetical protein